ncbi:tetratricopeptide repeat protein [Stenotrophomonas rhizophila]|uniref:tetratricopeptide repeat protein n=1 Tax=Stenotrophomonas rhizophila TaxID=216778 RepID=UPI001E316A73|nr:tetratricopeptide repeat protein [Stenotrophomonas rhizophila]MCC7635229.1 tetratricopeptide repeat protein [Stenotrophomonas rhizophila]MCC7664556.1 tetratricopeptide repeat protein [Stenotrophomonas rhizophila]
MEKPPTAVHSALDTARQHVDAAFNGIASADLALGNAWTILQRALVNEPASIPLLTCLGAVACDRGDHAGARVLLEQALALGSTDRHTAFNLGVALLNTGETTLARRQFARASTQSADPQTWAAYFDPQAG